MIDMICPHCKLGLKFPDQLAGQSSQCDKCGGEMYVTMPSHLQQKNQESMAYQFNVSMDEMQNPNLGLGMDASGMSNLMNMDDLDLMSATSGMSARSMGATSYSNTYTHLQQEGGSGFGPWFTYAAWLGVPAVILSGTPLVILGAPITVLVLALCVVDSTKSSGDTKTMLQWLLGLLFLFPFALPFYLLLRTGMEKNKAIIIAAVVGVVSVGAMFGLGIVTKNAVDGALSDSGAIQVQPPVQIQGDAGSTAN